MVRTPSEEWFLEARALAFIVISSWGMRHSEPFEQLEPLAQPATVGGVANVEPILQKVGISKLRIASDSLFYYFCTNLVCWLIFADTIFFNLELDPVAIYLMYLKTRVNSTINTITCHKKSINIIFAP